MKNQVTINADDVKKEFKIEVIVDFRSIQRHYFGYFGWRKWLATKLISIGASLVHGKAKIRS